MLFRVSSSTATFLGVDNWNRSDGKNRVVRPPDRRCRRLDIGWFIGNM